MAARSRSRVEVNNPLHPGSARQVDARMYDAMKRALLKVLPASPPGATLDELRQRVLAELPATLFPGGAKAGWWFKTVQLDLEAKGAVRRSKTRPLRLHRARRES